MKKRMLSIFMVLMLVLGVFPAPAHAANAAWASDAVTTLNEIYGSDVFSASTETMTQADAYTILTEMGCDTDSFDVYSLDPVTRGDACRVIANVYQLPVENGETAIEYLNEKNIINGYADGSLGEDDAITKAQFAVVTFRVLNSVGGGMGSSITALKPGTKEYFSWMYLAARRAVSFNSAAISGDLDEGTWNGWVSRLKELPTNAPLSSFTADYPSETINKLEAAVQMVDAYIDAGGSPTIFSDVTPSQGWYEGVMYLFDRQIVTGTGNGTFEPSVGTSRYELAVFLARMDGKTFVPADMNDRTYAIRESIKYATAPAQGYMSGTLDNDISSWTPDEYWSGNVTREEAVVALLKQANVSLADVNLAILDRFTVDSSNVSVDGKPYMAYAVSHGLISGTGANTLAPDGTVMRGQVGVLAYRILTGVDTSKMQDYEENVGYALNDAQ